MARRGRPTVEITLTGDERKTLEGLARRLSSSQVLALRCWVVLSCAEGRCNGEVAELLGVHPTSVSKWRHRFAEDCVDGLVDAPRPGARRGDPRHCRLVHEPPVAAAVFAVDGKPQIKALNRPAPTLAMLATTPARASHDYETNGT